MGKLPHDASEKELIPFFEKVRTLAQLSGAARRGAAQIDGLAVARSLDLNHSIVFDVLHRSRPHSVKITAKITLYF